MADIGLTLITAITMSYLPFLRPLWHALVSFWNYDADAVAEERYLAAAVDIYDLERRMADRTRVLHAGLSGR
jgi:hypothetical protein